MALTDEVLQLLSEHAGQPMDFVALFMLLNTVAGGHYEERCSEDELQATLATLMESGSVERYSDELSAARLGKSGHFFRLRTR